jgi:hypothetical protein
MEKIVLAYPEIGERRKTSGKRSKRPSDKNSLGGERENSRKTPRNGPQSEIELNYIYTIRGSGWGARIRTWEWRYQKPLPYRLATPHHGKSHEPEGPGLENGGTILSPPCRCNPSDGGLGLALNGGQNHPGG